MEFDFNNLYTNVSNLSSLKRGDIGIAADNLDWIKKCLNTKELFDSYKVKLTWTTPPAEMDLHPFEVLKVDVDEYTANREDYNNFAFFYKLPTNNIYTPLDLHNKEDINKLLSQPIVNEYGIRQVVGIDTNTCTAILVNYDSYPEQHCLESWEAKSLMKEWKFLDGSVIGNILKVDSNKNIK